MLRAEVRTTFTLVYRGYAIEVSRGSIGWHEGEIMNDKKEQEDAADAEKSTVGSTYPRSADLPILYRNEVQTSRLSSF